MFIVPDASTDDKFVVENKNGIFICHYNLSINCFHKIAEEMKANKSTNAESLDVDSFSNKRKIIKMKKSGRKGGDESEPTIELSERNKRRLVYPNPI